jgi:serine/threonine protein phosphatase PrpC
MTSTAADQLEQQPRPEEIDAFGLTHAGNVRPRNEDHFLIASFHRTMRVHASSMPADAFAATSSFSRGYVLLVADGVGRSPRGAEGSAAAIHSIARHILEMAELCLQTDPARADEVVSRLQAGVTAAHESLLAESDSGRGGMAATTLTLWIGIWPRAFVVHAGDSRCYRFRDKELELLTVDQTMAQALIEAGAVKPNSPEAARLKNVLLSALGAADMHLHVLSTDNRRGDITFLCSDGLTRHVSDDEIRERLLTGGTAEQICRDLVGLALERGGEDNVTAALKQIRG